MFNVTRPQPGPDCSTDYRSKDVVKTLKDEKLFECYCRFIADRRILKSLDSSQAEKDRAREHLIQMQDVSYPFSVFWKWHILSDSFLKNII
jgi:hypothetical protein